MNQYTMPLRVQTKWAHSHSSSVTSIPRGHIQYHIWRVNGLLLPKGVLLGTISDRKAVYLEYYIGSLPCSCMNAVHCWGVVVWGGGVSSKDFWMNNGSSLAKCDVFGTLSEKGNTPTFKGASKGAGQLKSWEFKTFFQECTEKILYKVVRINSAHTIRKAHL